MDSGMHVHDLSKLMTRVKSIFCTSFQDVVCTKHQQKVNGKSQILLLHSGLHPWLLRTDQDQDKR